eukprot:NODE_1572_length_807_cov_188.570588_g1523_i0.p2 GENE.NODE_1572_length_807_cov_188.570588_g1523_i0~~NODE_1572_length_807_cov_188.570588_g1523_i0.p2  ORF type:complete len:196 (-),score=81.23 NODE_1572_length_807_cov_188.570588_g1523_i0:142-729(-)
MTDAKPKAKGKATKKKTSAAHPTYDAMIFEAIKAVGKPVKGASRQAIAGFLTQKYGAGKLGSRFSTSLSAALKRLTTAGKLVQTKASWRVAAGVLKPKKAKKAKKVKKPKKKAAKKGKKKGAKKGTKKAGTKKAGKKSTKKTTGKKSTKKAGTKGTKRKSVKKSGKKSGTAKRAKAAKTARKNTRAKKVAAKRAS